MPKTYHIEMDLTGFEIADLRKVFQSHRRFMSIESKLLRAIFDNDTSFLDDLEYQKEISIPMKVTIAEE
jgi:hypothetical protein